MFNKFLKTAPMSVIYLSAKIQKILHKSQFFNIFSSKLICISIFYYFCVIIIMNTMNRLLKLMTTLLAVVVLFTTGCKKNTETNPNNGGGNPNPNTAYFFLDVDFLPIEETDGEAAPRLMANINDEVVMIELRRPSTSTPMESVLLLGPDNTTIMLCGNDSLMICAPYDIETYTPSDDVILVTYMDDNTLLLTKCVMDWDTYNMTTGDMMILPISESSKNLQEIRDIDGEIRSFFFNKFVKPLADGFEQVEHFCGVFGSPAGAVFASLRLIITTELTTILYSDDPEELYDHTTQSFTSTVANLVQTGLINLFKVDEFGMTSRILAGLGWELDGGHGAVNDYNGYTGSDATPYTLVISQAYHYMSAGQVVKPNTQFYVNMNVSNITETSAYFKGTFRFGNTSMPPVEMGYIYSVNGGPEYIEEDMDFHGITLTDLKKATKYKVRAYVKALMTNPVFSHEITFWTLGFEAFPNSLNFPADGDTKSIALSYSEEDITGWNITSSPSWCSVTKDGDKMITVTVGETTEARSGTITVTGYSNALGSVTQDIAVTQDGSNPSGFFAGTPFNNTRWNMLGTYNYTHTGIKRIAEWNNGHFTYHNENFSESDSFGHPASAIFKDNTLLYYGRFAHYSYEFIEDSIIIKIDDGSGDIYTTKCLNNVSFDIHNYHPGLGFSYTEEYNGSITISRYYVENYTFCVKYIYNYIYSHDLNTDYWVRKNYDGEEIIEFKISNNNQCSYHDNITNHYVSNYGSKYVGEIQGEHSALFQGAGTYIFGVNDNVVNSGNNSSDFTVITKIPMKKRD